MAMLPWCQISACQFNEFHNFLFQEYGEYLSVLLHVIRSRQFLPFLVSFIIDFLCMDTLCHLELLSFSVPVIGSWVRESPLFFNRSEMKLELFCEGESSQVAPYIIEMGVHTLPALFPHEAKPSTPKLEPRDNVVLDNVDFGWNRLGGEVGAKEAQVLLHWLICANQIEKKCFSYRD